jgi:hypothetical protein
VYVCVRCGHRPFEHGEGCTVPHCKCKLTQGDGRSYFRPKIVTKVKRFAEPTEEDEADD